MYKTELKKIDLQTNFWLSTNSNALKRNIVFSGNYFFEILFVQFIFIPIVHCVLF